MANEHNASHFDTLTQLRLHFGQRCKVLAVSSSAGLSQCESRAVEWESVLEAKELKLQRLPTLSAENAILCTKGNHPWNLVKTLGGKKKLNDGANPE